MLGLLVPPAHCHAEMPGTNKFPLRILYMGKPGSAREADFVPFLSQHFHQVSTGSWASFDAKQAADADVIVFDYDGGLKAPQSRLPTDYARPTLTIGVAGALFCMHLKLKTGYI